MVSTGGAGCSIVNSKATLGDRIAKGPIPVKAGNIMLTRDGVKVLDFGLAKSALTKALTAKGTPLGTAQYMVPEQFEGREAALVAGHDWNQLLLERHRRRRRLYFLAAGFGHDPFQLLRPVHYYDDFRGVHVLIVVLGHQKPLAVQRNIVAREGDPPETAGRTQT